MAVGISMLEANISAFRLLLNDAVKNIKLEMKIFPQMRISTWLDLHDIEDTFLDELVRLGPFGEGNPEPVFGIRSIIFRQAPQLFGDNHYRCYLILKNGSSLRIIAWRQSDRVLPANCALDIAVRLNWHFWKGRQSAQAELIDWRISKRVQL